MIKVFFKLCDLNIKKLLIYRASFYISFFLMLMWVGAYIVLVEVIFYITPSLAGWSKGEVLIILAFYYFIQNISDIFFKEGIEHFGQNVRRGELDFKIVKPASLRLLSFFWDMRFDHLAGMLVTVILFSYGTIHLPYTLSPIHVGLGIILLTFSIIFYYSILSIIATLTFWIEKNDTFNILIFNISQLSRYPRSIYTNFFGKLLSFGLPLALIASVPAEVALSSREPIMVITLAITSGVFYLISKIFWYHGVRRYTSAN